MLVSSQFSNPSCQVTNLDFPFNVSCCLFYSKVFYRNSFGPYSATFAGRHTRGPFGHVPAFYEVASSGFNGCFLEVLFQWLMLYVAPARSCQNPFCRYCKQEDEFICPGERQPNEPICFLSFRWELLYTEPNTVLDSSR